MPEFGRVVEPLPRLRLPLDRKTWLGGHTESGPVVPRARLFADGVLISRNDSLGFHSHGLERELWSHPITGLNGALELIDGPGETVLYKLGTVVTQYEVQSGVIRRSIDTRSQAFLVACSQHNFLLMSLDDTALLAFDWSGNEIWRSDYQGYCNILSTPDKYVVVEMSTKLRVMAADSGRVLWRFEADKTGDKGPQDHSNHLVPGFPSVVFLRGELMTIMGDGRIFKRDLMTGELLQQGQTPFRGPYQVSGESIFILNKHQGQFAGYNHLSMEETKREDLKEALKMFGDPLINALLVTDEALIWTTMEGTLMGLERQARPGEKRLAWLDPLGTSMPIGVPPAASAGSMYYPAMSLNPKVRIGLICYQSASV